MRKTEKGKKERTKKSDRDRSIFNLQEERQRRSKNEANRNRQEKNSITKNVRGQKTRSPGPPEREGHWKKTTQEKNNCIAKYTGDKDMQVRCRSG